MRLRRLTWAFASRLCDKYNNLMSWLKSPFATEIPNTYFYSYRINYRTNFKPSFFEHHHRSIINAGSWKKNKTNLTIWATSWENLFLPYVNNWWRSACPSVQSDQHRCCSLLTVFSKWFWGNFLPGNCCCKWNWASILLKPFFRTENIHHQAQNHVSLTFSWFKNRGGDFTMLKFLEPSRQRLLTLLTSWQKQDVKMAP